MTKPLPDAGRAALRTQLKAMHLSWCQGSDSAAAQDALSRHLAELLAQLEPTCLGLYWPLPGEVDPRPACMALATSAALALPWAESPTTKGDTSPVGGQMTFRRWDQQAPTTRDACGIPSPDTALVQPDVLVIPCVGVTRQGHRLGYGGGYYDRYLARHPHVTAIGLAWSHAVLPDAQYPPAPHDQPMMLVVTPEGVL